jgi:hypothetical protein
VVDSVEVVAAVAADVVRVTVASAAVAAEIATNF